MVVLPEPVPPEMMTFSRQRAAISRIRATGRRHRAEVDQLVEVDLPLGELADREAGAVERQRREDDVDAAAVGAGGHRPCGLLSSIAAADGGGDALGDVGEVLRRRGSGRRSGTTLPRCSTKTLLGAVHHDVGDGLVLEQRLERAEAEHVVHQLERRAARCSRAFSCRRCSLAISAISRSTSAGSRSGETRPPPAPGRSAAGTARAAPSATADWCGRRGHNGAEARRTRRGGRRRPRRLAAGVAAAPAEGGAHGARSAPEHPQEARLRAGAATPIAGACRASGRRCRGAEGAALARGRRAQRCARPRQLPRQVGDAGRRASAAASPRPARRGSAAAPVVRGSARAAAGAPGSAPPDSCSSRSASRIPASVGLHARSRAAARAPSSSRPDRLGRDGHVGHDQVVAPAQHRQRGARRRPARRPALGPAPPRAASTCSRSRSATVRRARRTARRPVPDAPAPSRSPVPAAMSSISGGAAAMQVGVQHDGVAARDIGQVPGEVDRDRRWRRRRRARR